MLYIHANHELLYLFWLHSVTYDLFFTKVATRNQKDLVKDLHMASNQRAFFILFFQKLGAIQYNTLTRPPGGSLCQQEAGVEQRTGHTAVNVEFITFIEFIDRNKDTKKEKRVRNKRKYTLNRYVIIKSCLVFDTFGQWEDKCLCRFKWLFGCYILMS